MSPYEHDTNHLGPVTILRPAEIIFVNRPQRQAGVLVVDGMRLRVRTCHHCRLVTTMHMCPACEGSTDAGMGEHGNDGSAPFAIKQGQLAPPLQVTSTLTSADIARLIGDAVGRLIQLRAGHASLPLEPVVQGVIEGALRVTPVGQRDDVELFLRHVIGAILAATRPRELPEGR